MQKRRIAVNTRMVNTKIWDDKYFSELDLTAKLAFLYFICNSRIKFTGIYEVTSRIKSFESGISAEELERIEHKFQSDGKIRFFKDWVLVVNARKYNPFTGTKLETAVRKELELIPPDVIEHLGFQVSYKEIIEEKDIERNRVTIPYQYPKNTSISLTSSNLNSNNQQDGNSTDSTVKDQSKKGHYPCTKSEIEEIAKELRLSFQIVENKHTQVMAKVLSNSLDPKRYPNVYYTLQQFLLNDIREGHLTQSQHHSSETMQEIQERWARENAGKPRPFETEEYKRKKLENAERAKKVEAARARKALLERLKTENPEAIRAEQI